MNFLKALATVSSMTLVSRVLGLVRDVVIARAFGAGVATDAFFVAFRIPNLLRRLFAEGAFSQAFVPVLSEYRNARGEQQTQALVNHVSTLLVVALVLVTVIGVMAAPIIIYVSAPGFSADSDKFDLTVALLRVTFPYILFISLTSFSGGILNTWSRFSIPALTPTLLNLSFIVFGLWLAPYFDPPVMALAWAVFCGGVLQLAFQVPFLVKIGMLPRLRWAPRDPGVVRIFRLMGPAVLGVSAGQISLLINTIFASFLVSGSVTWLYYADRLMELPMGLLGVALGTVLLPNLSKRFVDGSGYSSLLDWGLRLTMLLAVPCAVALSVLAIPIVATLFRHGEFVASDVLMTRDALVAYSIGLVGLVLVKVLAPGFYARQNMKTPVKIAVITLIATQLLNLVFIVVLNLGHVGLALSIATAAWVNVSLLYWKLRQQGVFTPQSGWLAFALKVAVASGAMAGVLVWSAAGVEFWQESGVWPRIWRLGWIIVAGAVSYFGALRLMGIRFRQFSRRDV